MRNSAPSMNVVPPMEQELPVRGARRLPCCISASPEDHEGAPGTTESVVLRLIQLGLAASAAYVIVTTTGFHKYAAFRFQVVVCILWCAWTLVLAAVCLYGRMAKRSLVNLIYVPIAMIGEAVIFALMMAALCASQPVLEKMELDPDINPTLPLIHECMTCFRFLIAEILAFLSSILGMFTFLIHLYIFGSLLYRRWNNLRRD